MKQLLFIGITCVTIFSGCTIKTVKVNRPVETIVVSQGDMFVIPRQNKIYLIVAKDLLKGKPIKNILTESDLEIDSLNSEYVTKVNTTVCEKE